MPRSASSGERSLRQAGAVLLMVTLLLLLVAKGQKTPVTPPPPASPQAGGSSSPDTPPHVLGSLAQRHRDPRFTVDVIYASPLLPSDEAARPVFRVVIAYSGRLPESLADLGSSGGLAQVRTSDGRVAENLVWQEELRGDGRILGYLTYPPEDRPLLTRSTRWIELSLVGLTAAPVRFRWPVAARGRG